MGYLLASRLELDELVSLRITHSGGSAWVCTGSEQSDCVARELDGEDWPEGVELFTDSEDAPYTGRVHVGGITASPPATE